MVRCSSRANPTAEIFFIQNPQGYQNDVKANKTICHASVLDWCILDTESTFAKACICFWQIGISNMFTIHVFRK